MKLLWRATAVASVLELLTKVTQTQSPNKLPEKLHTIRECAAALGCHAVSLYKAVNGQNCMPAPRMFRIGRLVRGLDWNFHDFLAGLISVKTPPRLSQRKVGRPTKAAQIALRRAGGAA